MMTNACTSQTSPALRVPTPPMDWPDPDNEWTQRAAFVARIAHEDGRTSGASWAKCSWAKLCELMPEQARRDISSVALVTGQSREAREEIARFLLSY